MLIGNHVKASVRTHVDVELHCACTLGGTSAGKEEASKWSSSAAQHFGAAGIVQTNKQKGIEMRRPLSLRFPLHTPKCE